MLCVRSCWRGAGAGGSSRQRRGGSIGSCGPRSNLDVGEVESGAFWVEFIRGLKQRGLDGVRLAISDQHEGLKAAIARVLGCPWQRCTVHFLRDMVREW
jgi:transposase-like protein